MNFDGDEYYEISDDDNDDIDSTSELYGADDELTELCAEKNDNSSITELSEQKGPIEYSGEKNDIKTEISEKSEYSADVNEHINSVEELEVYQKAGLKEDSIDGRTCLIRDDIDYDYVDEKTGMTNRELMEKGRPPYDSKTGERIELHHIGQDYDSPLAELTADSEHGDGNHAILHPEESDSWRQDSEKNNYYNNVQRPNHWKART